MFCASHDGRPSASFRVAASTAVLIADATKQPSPPADGVPMAVAH